MGLIVNRCDSSIQPVQFLSRQNVSRQCHKQPVSLRHNCQFHLRQLISRLRPGCSQTNQKTYTCHAHSRCQIPSKLFDTSSQGCSLVQRLPGVLIITPRLKITLHFLQHWHCKWECTHQRCEQRHHNELKKTCLSP